MKIFSKILLVIIFSGPAIMFAQAGSPDATTFLNEGKQLLKEKKPAEAVDKFDAVLKIDPVNTEALFDKGFCLMVTGKHADALPCFEKITAVSNAYPMAYAYMGDIYCMQRDFDKAIAPYSKAVSLMPRNPQVWYNLGSAYLNAGKFAQAQAAEVESIKINDHVANNQQFYGVAALLQGKNAEAVLALSAYIMSVKPDDKIAADSYRFLKMELEHNPKTTTITDPIAKMQRDLVTTTAAAAVAGKTNLTPVDSLTLQLTSVFKAVKEQEDQYGSVFFSKYYGNFFGALAATDNMNTFAHLIAWSQSPTETEAWVKDHPDNVKALTDWVKNTKRETE